jgi:transposase
LRLFVGDDWAEQHHDVELMDASGRRLAKARLPEGVAGMTKLHAMIAGQLGEAAEEAEVVIGIETDRGPWVQALVAAGYTVLAVNPLQASRYQERLSVSGAKSDAADAHMLADMVRTDSHQLRPVAGDSAEAEAIKVVIRAHKTLIWERTRHAQRLRHACRACRPGPPTPVARQITRTPRDNHSFIVSFHAHAEWCSLVEAVMSSSATHHATLSG